MDSESTRDIADRFIRELNMLFVFCLIGLASTVGFIFFAVYQLLS